MHFKRKRPKSTRAGCLLCKPHKRQGTCLHERLRFHDRRRAVIATEKITNFRCE